MSAEVKKLRSALNGVLAMLWIDHMEDSEILLKYGSIGLSSVRAALLALEETKEQEGE